MLDVNCGSGSPLAGGAAATGYVNIAGCEAACNVFVTAKFAGTTTDVAVNTMGCRYNYAGQATGADQGDEDYCSYASITGGISYDSKTEGCAPLLTDGCTAYCLVDNAFCPDTWSSSAAGVNSPNFTYCLLGCAGSLAVNASIDPVVGGYDQYGNEYPIDTQEDNVQCRAYHAIAGGVLGFPHCAHASLLGGLQCATGVVGDDSSAIEDFCENIYLTCALLPLSTTGKSLYPYTDVDTCITDVTEYVNTTLLGVEWGQVNASHNDLGCRSYHGGIPSVVAGSVHCAHTAINSVACGNAAPSPATSAPITTNSNGATSDAATLVAALAFVVAILSVLF